LRSEGVDTSNVEIINRSRTGLALVSVYDSGENSITVIPGANFQLTADRVTRSVERLTRDAGSAVVVVQAELVTDIITATATAAERAGARLVLNLAPYQPLAAHVLAACNPLVLNEAEASALVGWKVTDAATAARATEQLGATVRSVVVTIGAEGAYWADQSDAGHVPAPPIAQVVDTTGAGDAFVGALASCLARGEHLHRAVEIGVLAGSFAVTSPGAQSSYPTLTGLGVDPARPPAVRA